jgi:hypothetical protein
MNADRGIFAFEADFAGTLRCIPMNVRFKLDQCGVKLALKQWNRFPTDDRQYLVNRPCETTEQILRYGEYLTSLITLHTRSTAEFVAVEPAPAWADLSQVPRRLSSYATAWGVSPPSVDQWAALTALQRFSLFKLTRPNHDNDNFLPAMREFGLAD